MDNTKPLSPSEILDDLENIIPGFIIEAVNNLLKQEFRGSSCTIKQKDIVTEIKRLKPDVNKEDIFDKKWLDFEEVYRKHGWKVSYDKPGYSESYDAFYTFDKK